MAVTHTVEQGEHLAQIAEKYGFLDYMVIWNHPNNKALTSLRKNPNVLFPGDSLFIPDRREKKEPVPTTRVHWFKIKIPKLRLRIVIKDYDHKPIPNLDCELEVDGTVHALKTAQDGLLDKEIPASAKGGSLRIPAMELEFPVSIGHLDPTEEDPGWRARLINLGYYLGPEEEDEEMFRHAVEEFQCDQKIKVTGELDGATRAKLKELHGC